MARVSRNDAQRHPALGANPLILLVHAPWHCPCTNRKEKASESEKKAKKIKKITRQRKKRGKSMPSNTTFRCASCAMQQATHRVMLCHDCGAGGCCRRFHCPSGHQHCEACCTCDSAYLTTREPSATFTGEPTPRFPRYLGVELECGWRGTRAANALVSEALTRHGAGLHDDGSVRVNGASWEIVSSPARGEAFEAQIKDLCGALHAAGASVNRSCGTHVHVDARDYRIEHVLRFAVLWARVERTMYSIVARSRRTNTFCAPWGDVLNRGPHADDAAPLTERERSLGIATYGSEYAATECKRYRSKHSSRYHGLNFNALDNKQTIEFRLHHGTLSARKVMMWAAVCSALVEYAYTHTETEIRALRGTPAEILDRVLTDREVARWVKSRRRFFENEERTRRGIAPRPVASTPAPIPPAPEEPHEVEEGETHASSGRVGRRAIR